MLFVLIVVPAALIAAAAVLAFVSVARSSLRITSAGVEIHNHRQEPEHFPLARVDRFEPTPPVGFLSSLQPRTAVLVLTDGTRHVVRSVSDPDAGSGIPALNARLDALRRAT
ncbi:MAG: hypothetical protein ACXVJ7_17305 [Acidimicrobiia bacterium]